MAIDEAPDEVMPSEGAPASTAPGAPVTPGTPDTPAPMEVEEAAPESPQPDTQGTPATPGTPEQDEDEEAEDEEEKKKEEKEDEEERDEEAEEEEENKKEEKEGEEERGEEAEEEEEKKDEEKREEADEEKADEEKPGDEEEEKKQDESEHAEEATPDSNMGGTLTPSAEKRVLTSQAPNENEPPKKVTRLSDDASATIKSHATTRQNSTARSRHTTQCTTPKRARIGDKKSPCDTQEKTSSTSRPVATATRAASNKSSGEQVVSEAKPAAEHEATVVGQQISKSIQKKKKERLATLKADHEKKLATLKAEHDKNLEKKTKKKDFLGCDRLCKEFEDMKAQEKEKLRVAMEMISVEKASPMEKPTSLTRKELESQIQKFAAAYNFEKAADLKKELDRLPAQEEDENLEELLACAIENQDFVEADKLNKDIAKKEMVSRVREDRLKAVATAARSAATAAEEKVKKLQEEMDHHAKKRDFLKAAEVKKQQDEAIRECRAKVQVAEEQESMVDSLGMSVSTTAEDHELPACVQHTAPVDHADISGLTTQTDRSAPAQAESTAPRLHGVKVSVADLRRTDTPLPSAVWLEGVRILSMSKISSVPGQKGKSKNKGKSMGKGKDGKGKGKDKSIVKAGDGKDGRGRQDAKVAYVGKDKHCIAILAFGDDVHRLCEGLIGCLVDIGGLRPRAGQLGTLYWQESTTMVKRLEPFHTNTPPMFEYETSAVTQDLATMAFIQDLSKDDLAALVIRPQSVEQSWTQGNEPFLIVHGYDMNNAATGALRLWRHETGDMTAGNIYLIRGLKVANKNYWSDEDWGYVPTGDGAKVLEVSMRTAIEDVSHVEAIANYFP